MTIKRDKKTTTNEISTVKQTHANNKNKKHDTTSQQHKTAQTSQ